MTIEDKLKTFILSRYKSIREFSIECDIPYTTIKSMMIRGIGNSSLSNVIQICNFLNISVDELANGNIVPKTSKRDNSTVEISSVVNEAKSRLSLSDHLTINGKEIDVEFADPILDALDIGYEMVKRKSKKDVNVD